MMKPTCELTPHASKGQAILLIAVAFIVLLAIVGLATDVGQLFIYMGHLRRATDAASLSAAAQYREGRTNSEMIASASQVINLNGIDPKEFTVVVENCDTNPTDPQLCTTPRRKLVRVLTSLKVPMSFLSVVGLYNVNISSSSIGEAASLDIVLVIDISESMTWDAASNDPMRDPHACNNADPSGTDGYPGSCQPFQEVKRAAASFISRILNKSTAQEEDRLTIVTFANGWSGLAGQGTRYRTLAPSGTSYWTSDRDYALNIVRTLDVYDPGTCYSPQNDPTGAVVTQYGGCRFYNPDNSYAYMDCLSCRKDLWPSPQPQHDDWSTLTTTNTGGGMQLAGDSFAYETRQEALWVVVMLSDGMANATFPDKNRSQIISDWTTYPIGFCPNESANNGSWVYPLCQDENVTTRHATGNVLYDADDYARDMADYVGCSPIKPAAKCKTKGQGAVVFTIGLGSGVLDNGCSRGTCEASNRPYGASLLRYIAAVGYSGDPDPVNDPCKGISDYTKWCGNYYYAPQGPQLSRIFEDIASRIFTRLVH
jgi:Flp pilus assembly protein TadG